MAKDVTPLNLKRCLSSKSAPPSQATLRGDWRQFSDRRHNQEPRKGDAQSDAAPVFADLRKPMILLALLLLFIGILVPRARAAWRLNHLGSIYADYALCMVGPTGPDLLFAPQGSYLKLLRRRVIASRPETQPFRACKSFAKEVSSLSDFIDAHELSAQEFVEFSGSKFNRQSVRLLELGLNEMQELKNRGGFLVRKPLASLIKPSRHAKEAIHPPAPSLPSLGLGLPLKPGSFRNTAAFGNHIVATFSGSGDAKTFVSEDKGLSFRASSRTVKNPKSGTCYAQDEKRTYSLSPNMHGELLVVYRESEKRLRFATLLKQGEQIRSIACDEFGLVALIGHNGSGVIDDLLSLRECKFGKTCINLSQPSPGSLPLRFPAEVEKVGGDTIISLVSNGVVRVTSSRDSGAHWLPWTVAYDREESSFAHAAPFHLLKIANDLLLYGDADNRGAYPLLVSSDHGASFQPHQLKPHTLALGASHQ